MKISKKKLTMFFSAVLALSLIAGIWAYFTAQSQIDNKLQTGEYGVRTVEKFTPEEEIQPGQQITKEVGVVNTGDYGLVVRVKMEETWTRDGSTVPYKASHDAAGNPLYDFLTPYQANATDGLTAADDTVVGKTLPGVTSGKWVLHTDGYYYYKEILGAGKSTGTLLESLLFKTDMDMGVYETKEYYSTALATVVDPAVTAVADAQTALDTAIAGGNAAAIETAKTNLKAAKDALETAYGWVEVNPSSPVDPSTITYKMSDTSLKTGYEGYANSEYTLTIITDVCQATKDAVTATWGTDLPPVWTLP